jgi:hypothetical protein
MAEAGLFLGWGPPVHGREQQGLDVFNEAVQWYGQLQQDGRIESFEVALLEPHGGDLAGFILVRGSVEQMSALRTSEDFERITTRASLIVENIGVVGAYINEGLARAMGIYQAQLDDLT